MMYDGTFPIGGYIYLGTMGFIIYDDIILIRYLYKRIKSYYINRAISAKNLYKLNSHRFDGNDTVYD